MNDDQKIIEHSCDCPYDWGDVCKHEVATIYYLKDSELYKQPIEKSTIHKVKNNLDKLNKNEVIDIIVELSKRNKTIREEISFELGYE